MCVRVPPPFLVWLRDVVKMGWCDILIVKVECILLYYGGIRLRIGDALSRENTPITLERSHAQRGGHASLVAASLGTSAIMSPSEERGCV